MTASAHVLARTESSRMMLHTTDASHYDPDEPRDIGGKWTLAKVDLTHGAKNAAHIKRRAEAIEAHSHYAEVEAAAEAAEEADTRAEAALAAAHAAHEAAGFGWDEDAKRVLVLGDADDGSEDRPATNEEIDHLPDLVAAHRKAKATNRKWKLALALAERLGSIASRKNEKLFQYDEEVDDTGITRHHFEPIGDPAEERYNFVKEKEQLIVAFPAEATWPQLRAHIAKHLK